MSYLVSIPGNAIRQLTMFNSVTSDSSSKPFTEKSQMVRAARKLLSAITKVLLIADKVIVKQLIVSKDKVRTSVFISSIIQSIVNTVLKMLGLYLYTLTISHKSCNM